MDIFKVVTSLALLQIINEALGKRHKYCDYKRNVFFDDISGDCNKCSPCRIGWGVDDKIAFSIDSLRGATGCRKCRPCADGTFQKRHNVFRKCKECRRCSHPGQIEINKCTDRQNAKCDKEVKPKIDVYKLMKNRRPEMDRLILNTGSTIVTREAMADIHLTASTSKVLILEENDVYSNVLLGFVAACTFIVTLVVTIVYLRMCIRKHRKRHEDQRSIESIDNLYEAANKDDIGDAKTDSTLILLHKEPKDGQI